MPNVNKRFDSKWRSAPNGCRLWTAGVDKDGYGKFSIGRRSMRAHVYAWERKHGPVPDGMVLDHVVCDTPGCVHEDHVAPTTNRANVLSGKGITARFARATHCVHGHPFTIANTYVRPSGGRECKICKRWRSHLRHNPDLPIPSTQHAAHAAE